MQRERAVMCESAGMTVGQEKERQDKEQWAARRLAGEEEESNQDEDEKFFEEYRWARVVVVCL